MPQWRGCHFQLHSSVIFVIIFGKKGKKTLQVYLLGGSKGFAQTWHPSDKLVGDIFAAELVLVFIIFVAENETNHSLAQCCY